MFRKSTISGVRKATISLVTMESRYDVIVVGAGMAGLAAVLSAVEHGVQVLLVEKAPVSQRGGNGRRSSSFRASYGDLKHVQELVASFGEKDPFSIRMPPYSNEDYYRDLMAVTQGQADPDLARTLVERSFETLEWLKSLGVEFELNPKLAVCLEASWYYPPGSPIQIKGGGEGESLATALFRRIEEHGVPVLYEAQVSRLLLNDAGRVVGIALEETGALKSVHSKAVILGCGGFEADSEMRKLYLGQEWERARVRGTPHNTGDGIRLAFEAGADRAGDWGGAHAGMIDANAPEVLSNNRAVRRSYPYGIIVNANGERFFDEGEDFEPLLYAKSGRAVLRQPGGIAFQIFDEKAKNLLSPYYKDATQVVASSVAELATELQIDPKRLDRTISEFNRSIADVPFNPGIKDGRCTQGITPRKSNWAQALDSPPFRAFPGVCGITFTFGGIRINPKAQVISVKGSPIPGLYAAGEITGGLLYHHYPLGASFMNAAVFGRIAGEQAAWEN